MRLLGTLRLCTKKYLNFRFNYGKMDEIYIIQID